MNAYMIENFQSFLRLRSRSAWEASDSGILIWRNNITYILSFMGIPFLSCVVLLALLNSHILFFSSLILWWLKPFYDRFILQVISVRFFRNDANHKTIRKGLIKNIFKGLMGDITWRRFSIYRSTRMPVRILEGNKRKITMRRIRNLKNGGLDFGALLTLLSIVLEIVLFGGFAFSLYRFFAENADVTFYTISEYSSQISLALLFLSALVILIIEPLYMCMGFGIYINSRSIVEGWDIELGFNSFVAEKKSKSLSTKSFSSAKTISLIILLLLLNIFQPVQVYAEEWYQNNSEEAPVEILDEVLLSEDFGNSYTRKWIRFKDFNRDDSSSGFNFDEANIKEIIGFILRAMLVLIIAAGLIFIGYRLFKTKGNLFSNQSVPWQKGIIPRFAEKENVESLLNAARKLFDEGQIRKAWAACLSAVLGIYANQESVNFALNDTESDCLIKINHTLLWGKEDAALLILRWIKLAYAGIEPLPEQFNDALSFCEELKNKLSHLGDADE